MLEPDTARLACHGTDPSAAAEPPTILLREGEETPSRSWILTARDNDAGSNARDNPERLLFLDDLAVVWPHLQFKGGAGVPVPLAEQLILQRNLLYVVSTF